MNLFYYTLIGLFLSQSAFAGEKEFIAWWKNDGLQEKAADGSKYFRKKIELNFNALEEEKIRTIKKPVAVKKDIERVLLLYKQKNLTLLLITPPNIMKNETTIDEQYYETMRKCADDRSWIVAVPGNAWSEVDLNPYCKDSYGEDEIGIILYWVGGANRPLIEIVTNGPACVPHQLYGWDRKANKYILKEIKCTG